MKLLTYYHTLKYLKFTQVYHRVLKKIKHPKIRDVESVRSLGEGAWITQKIYTQKFFDETNVIFLNCKGEVNKPSDWNSSKQNKLWLYNLHYFDDLNSFGSQSRSKLQIYWINKWIAENPAKDGGNGWEAYTLSLRIVNWTKACLSGLAADKQLLDSLAQQADFLSQDLEKHLLGNHYFVNLKALLFAGCFFDGRDANKWLMLALKDYEKELKEQVLNDGGSFELTPMYHSIMLTDLLDLYNLFKTYPSKIPLSVIDLTKQKIIIMLVWLNQMSLGDDKVSFFNDSAFGIAPDNSVIREYATKLGFGVNEMDIPEDTLLVNNLKNTGYVSIKSNDFCLIADLSPVGPSYIPGHAHADSLSFELSLGQSRVFVNSGISEYGMSDERLRQRGTSSHNTVLINERNSSEVWSGFRVARRADIKNRRVEQLSSEQKIEFSAAHNGYKKLGINCVHHRTWNVSLISCKVKDYLQGNFESSAGFLHLHPDIEIEFSDNNSCRLRSHSYTIHLKIEGAKIMIENSTWHPEFGIVLSSKRLMLKYSSSTVIYQIDWKKS